MKNQKPDFLLLGSEKQAAASFALAYPHLNFIFVTDRSVVDGWDLPNAKIVKVEMNDFHLISSFKSSEIVLLSSRWSAVAAHLNHTPEKYSLTDTLRKINAALPEIALPFESKPSFENGTKWMVKGNFWHKPDATEIIESERKDVSVDDDGCELFYQRYVDHAETFISFGRVVSGKVLFGNFKVHRESNAREDFILAAETVQEVNLESHTKKVLSVLNHEGFFAINWIRSNDLFYLTSFRPEPKALISSMIHGGVNLLELELSEVSLAKPGIKMISEIHYSSYQE